MHMPHMYISIIMLLTLAARRMVIFLLPLNLRAL